ncbi:hypothetical protein H0H92_009402 [Tricholoma furcatifolium]|nr:hypothetical protein H0H92_009402 [Tricholoma furcatifolium]
MIIPINVASSSSSSNPKLPPNLAKISHDEVVLIELQGAFEVECNHPSEREGKLIGKLNFDPATNKSTLLVGHHLLEGKLTSLAKPLAVLLRSKPASSSTITISGTGAIQPDEDDEDVEMLNDDHETQLDTVDTKTNDNNAVEWDMVALVKRKIVFAKRPMPVVNLNNLKVKG